MYYQLSNTHPHPHPRQNKKEKHIILSDRLAIILATLWFLTAGLMLLLITCKEVIT